MYLIKKNLASVTFTNNSECSLHDFHFLCTEYISYQVKASVSGTPTLPKNKIIKVFLLLLQGNPLTELAQAVDIMMVQAKSNYILMIKVNKLFLFFIVVFSKGGFSLVPGS